MTRIIWSTAQWFQPVLVVWIVTVSSALETSLNILSPATLNQRAGYSHQTAEFGFTQCPFSYADQNCRLQEALFYIDTPICDENSLLQASDNLEEALYSLTSDESFFLLVERGDCDFATTARLVQTLGAAGLFIADNSCLCSAGEACTATNEIPCALSPPVLVDDNNSNSIYIPTVLMQKQDADAIKAHKTLQPNSRVSAELTWPMTPAVSDDVVTIDFWHVPGPYRTGGQAILPALKQIVYALAPQVSFTPQFSIISGRDIGCHPESVTETEIQPVTGVRLCDDLCTNNGRYCATDPEMTPYQGVSGADVVLEILRRRCIWDLYGRNETDLVGVQFWKYVDAFYETCTKSSFTPPATYNNMWMDEDACSRVAMSEAEVESEAVARCIIRSGGAIQDKDNSLLEESLQESAAVGAFDPPMLIVNNVGYRGQTFSETFGAICASFGAFSIPEACSVCTSCLDDYTCLVNGGVCTDASASIPPVDSSPSLPPAPADIQDGGNSGETNGSGPTTPAPALGIPEPPTDDEASAFPTSVFSDNAEPPAASPESNVNESTGGLSDDTKVIIVVAVVGGAILVIFAFVMVLVWRLLKRIRQLEKKDKATPTTTSPGSNAWELPVYVIGKEDPFNNDCEPVPNVALDGDPGTKGEPSVDTAAVEPSVNVAEASDVVPGEALADESGEKASHGEPSRVVEESSNRAQPSCNSDGDVKGTALRSSASEAATIFISDDISANENSNSTELTPTKSGKARSPSERSKARPRKSKQDPSLIAIMGRAAPEARVPRSFSYEDEEKEEIANDVFEKLDDWMPCGGPTLAAVPNT